MHHSSIQLWTRSAWGAHCSTCCLPGRSLRQTESSENFHIAGPLGYVFSLVKEENQWCVFDTWSRAWFSWKVSWSVLDYLPVAPDRVLTQGKSKFAWKCSIGKAIPRRCCCDRKSRAACAQSFAPWQQATIEITRRDHSIIACSRHIHIFLFFAHIPFVVNHTINVTPPERLQQCEVVSFTFIATKWLF